MEELTMIRSAGRPVWINVSYVLGLLGLSVVGSWFVYHQFYDADADTHLEMWSHFLEESAERPTWLTVSRETTFITEPLDEDGCVDYVAAFNAMLSEGITTENNATVMFVAAGCDFSEFSKSDQELFFKLLGIEPPPRKGTYFQNLDLSDPEIKENLEQAMKDPWSVETFPELAEWLGSNEQPLELVIQGTRRPRSYSPLIRGARPYAMLNSLLPVAQQARMFARALVSRAMLRLNDAKIDDSLSDLLACHRLARLIGSGKKMILGLVAFEIDRHAWNGDVAVLRSKQLSAASAMSYQTELGNLQPLLMEKVTLDESVRMMLLDTVSSISLPRQITGLSKDDESGKNAKLKVMYDEMLRACNQGMDQYAEAGSWPTFPERMRASLNLEEELRNNLSGIEDSKSPDDPRMLKFIASKARQLKGKSPREIGRELGRVSYSLLMPSLTVALKAEAVARNRELLGQIGFALAAYYADHSVYPDTLDLLVPNYIPRIPDDYYDHRPFQYRKRGDGYVLYSCGANDFDDTEPKFKTHSPPDDIVLEIVGNTEQIP